MKKMAFFVLLFNALLSVSSQEAMNIYDFLNSYIESNHLPIIITDDKVEIIGNITDMEKRKFINVLNLCKDITLLNIAYSKVTRTNEGNVYLRRTLAVVDKDVEIVYMAINLNINKVNYIYDPLHPHAGLNGYVLFPDVNVIEETNNLDIISNIFNNFIEAYNKI
jgi:flagellar basal body rod protein FlgC